jgi:hypothetical protein
MATYFVHILKAITKPVRDIKNLICKSYYGIIIIIIIVYVGNTISKLQIEVATYVFWIKCGKLSPLDSSTI